MTEESNNDQRPLEANFLQFLYGMAAQTQIQLGLVPHPLTGEQRLDSVQAKYSLELLNIFSQKTKGNLEDDEEEYLTSVLKQLQVSYDDLVK